MRSPLLHAAYQERATNFGAISGTICVALGSFLYRARGTLAWRGADFACTAQSGPVVRAAPNGTRSACQSAMAAATITTDHDEIKAWVEERGGFPARVRATGDNGDPGIIRVDFPGFTGDGSLERISWDEWFQAFEQSKLAFLHQEETEDGQVSHFNKLVSQESIERAEPRVRRQSQRAAQS